MHTGGWFGHACAADTRGAVRSARSVRLTWCLIKGTQRAWPRRGCHLAQFSPFAPAQGLRPAPAPVHDGQVIWDMGRACVGWRLTSRICSMHCDMVVQQALPGGPAQHTTHHSTHAGLKQEVRGHERAHTHTHVCMCALTICLRMHPHSTPSTPHMPAPAPAPTSHPHAHLVLHAL